MIKSVPADAADDAGLERFRFALEGELAELAACSYQDLGQPVPRALEAVAREHSRSTRDVPRNISE